MKKSPRLRLLDRAKKLQAVVIDQLVADDDPVRAIWTYVTTLDLDGFLKSIQAVEGQPGRNATDPRLLVALWMFATVEGIGSARWLAKLCRRDNCFRWLCGGVTVNAHMLSDFRKDFARELETLLNEHVAILMHVELVQLKRVAQDGMRVRASAGSSSFHRRESLAECQREVRQQLELLQDQPEEKRGSAERRCQAAKKRHAQEKLERLKAAHEVAAELAAKRQRRLEEHPSEALQEKTEDAQKKAPRGSTTDPECRRMKMADGGYRPAYNVQAMTTTDEKIIVAVDVTNQGTDSGLLVPMLQKVETTHGKKPEEALVDGGFVSASDVETAEANGTKVYMPLKNQKKELALGKNPYQPKPKDKAGMKSLRARMATEQAKEIYKQRASTAEWVNAGMRNRGLYQFRVRGLAAVRGVVLIHALVHNLFQTIRLCVQKKPQRHWADVLREGASQVNKNAIGDW